MGEKSNAITVTDSDGQSTTYLPGQEEQFRFPEKWSTALEFAIETKKQLGIGPDNLPALVNLMIHLIS